MWKKLYNLHYAFHSLNHIFEEQKSFSTCWEKNIIYLEDNKKCV